MGSENEARIVLRREGGFALTDDKIAADPEACRYVGLRFVHGAGNVPLHILADGRFVHLVTAGNTRARVRAMEEARVSTRARMFYGLFLTKKGDVSVFFVTPQDILPSRILIFRECGLSPKEAQAAAEGLRVKYVEDPKRYTPDAKIRCVYGLRRTRSGVVRPFTAVADAVPRDAFYTLEKQLPMAEACHLAERLKIEHSADSRAFYKRHAGTNTLIKAKDPEPEAPVEPELKVVAGAVVVCSDSQGSHVAIVLELRPGMSHVLMLTSRPGWNRFARLATDDELMLCGRPLRKRTYLAPTDFPTSHLTLLHGVFPAHRLEALRTEFGESFKVTGITVSASDAPKP